MVIDKDPQRRILGKGNFILTKGGRPIFKIVSLNKKREGKRLTVWDKFKEFYGSWSKTGLDDDKLWEEIIGKDKKRGTRKKKN